MKKLIFRYPGNDTVMSPGYLTQRKVFTIGKAYEIIEEFNKINRIVVYNNDMHRWEVSRSCFELPKQKVYPIP